VLGVALVSERGSPWASQDASGSYEGEHWSWVSRPAVGADGTVYVLWSVGDLHDAGEPPTWPTRGPGRNYLYAFKPDGALKWGSSLGGGDLERIILKIGPSGTIYVAGSRSLYALDSHGAEKWKVSSQPAWLDLGPDGTAYFYADGLLYALSPDGTQKWKMSAQGTHMVGPDGTVYLTAGNLLQAINPEGRRRWSLALGEVFMRALCCPQLKSGNAWAIYAVGNDNLYAVAPNGTQKWKFPFAGRLVESLDFGPDGTIYFPANTANGHGRVYALRTDGTQKWKFDAPGEVYGVRVGGEGAIYAWGGGRGSPDEPGPSMYPTEPDSLEVHPGGEIYALRSDGTLKWELPCREDSGQCRAAEPRTDWLEGPVYGVQVVEVGPDDSLYVLELVGNWGGNVAAIGPDGKEKWAFAATSFGLAFGADGTIYLADGISSGTSSPYFSSALYALTPSGAEKWCFDQFCRNNYIGCPAPPRYNPRRRTPASSAPIEER
jgi:hypothetical protein